MTFRPKFVTFDCYGTLTHFDMAGAARRVYGATLDEAAMTTFIKNFAAYRLDEIRGPEAPCRGRPQRRRAHLQRNGVAFRAEGRGRLRGGPDWGRTGRAGRARQGREGDPACHPSRTR